MTEKILVSSLNLEARGKRLFKEMTTAYPNLDPIQLELLVEACRIVDQLEKLHDIARGHADSWAFVKMPRQGGSITVEIDNAVTAQRQLQLALKTITATLTVAGEGSGANQGEGVVNDIAARAERRRAEALGRHANGGSNTPS